MRINTKIALFPLFVFAVLSGFIPLQGQEGDVRYTTQKFNTALQIIKNAYVDTVNEPALVEEAIEAILKDLDPHSIYISKKDLQRANEPLEGTFEGIGISFQIFHDTILVISPVQGGPSERLGIMAGDKIIKINGENATGKHVNNNYVFKRLRGKKGTMVNVTILREGRDRPLEYTIIRDKIPIYSIDAAFKVNKEIGYIKVNRFARTTAEEFHKALTKLKEQHLKKLILDLRGNSGGYLDVAIDLADEFIGFGKLIVYTQGHSSPKRKYKSTFKGGFEEGELVVLIDEGSASASEIVAGAIQDWDRGILVGRRSFGKGLVQRPFYLPDSSVIRLTVARYYTPSGRCIQKPYKNGYEQYYKDLETRLNRGELTHPDSINFPDSVRYYTEHHRIVYGGGGIMPDVFVPWDSTEYTDFYVDLLSKGMFSEFILGYVEQERKYLKERFPTFNDFNTGFDVKTEIMDDFLRFARTKYIFPKEGELSASNEIISHQLKAVLARNLYDFESYFKVMTQIDDAFNKAVEVLMNTRYFAELKKEY